LDKLERALGSRHFREIFKTITCDNGGEFMDAPGIEQSCLTRKKRTVVYYAHPYCACERGSNENANGIIRRFIPKGAAIGEISKQRIKQIQVWMNNYPRRILAGLSANEAFEGVLA
jgi:IS30 family transposase